MSMVAFNHGYLLTVVQTHQIKGCLNMEGTRTLYKGGERRPQKYFGGPPNETQDNGFSVQHFAQNVTWRSLTCNLVNCLRRSTLKQFFF